MESAKLSQQRLNLKYKPTLTYKPVLNPKSLIKAQERRMKLETVQSQQYLYSPSKVSNYQSNSSQQQKTRQKFRQMVETNSSQKLTVPVTRIGELSDLMNVLQNLDKSSGSFVQQIK